MQINNTNNLCFFAIQSECYNSNDFYGNQNKIFTYIT